MPSEAESCLRGLVALRDNPFYRHLVHEALETANLQLQEVLDDDGVNTNKHYKAIGFVNGLQKFNDILTEQIALYGEKAKVERENMAKPSS